MSKAGAFTIWVGLVISAIIYLFHPTSDTIEAAAVTIFALFPMAFACVLAWTFTAFTKDDDHRSDAEHTVPDERGTKARRPPPPPGPDTIVVRARRKDDTTASEG